MRIWERFDRLPPVKLLTLFAVFVFCSIAPSFAADPKELVTKITALKKAFKMAEAEFEAATQTLNTARIMGEIGDPDPNTMDLLPTTKRKRDPDAALAEYQVAKAVYLQARKNLAIADVALRVAFLQAGARRVDIEYK